VSRLSKVRKPGKKKSKIKSKHLIAGSFLTIILLLLAFIALVSALYLIDKSMESELDFIEITTTTSTTSTTSTSTSISPPTMSTIHETTTVYTTTTIACGGSYETPCILYGKRNCDKHLVLGSDNICKPAQCAPTKPSGKSGCGEWALNYCTA